MSNIVIVGAGYVGLATAVCFAHLGHDVAAAETDAARLTMLRTGEPPFYERGMRQLLQDGMSAGRLRFGTPTEIDYGAAEFVFLCVPTPQGPDGSADLSAIEEAARFAGPRLRSGAIVVDKSTVPVGTARHVAGILKRNDVFVASNPEFLQEGAAIATFLQSERVVVGADDPDVARRVADLYAPACSQLLLIGLESAELAKYACNAFLATKLSFVNSLLALCNTTGADIGEIAEVMGTDSRIGAKFLQSGPGWGGSCFPKDVRALMVAARRVGIDLHLLEAAIKANEDTFSLVAEQVADLCGGDLTGRRIAVWGLTFKAGTDDLRDSPSIEIIRRLLAVGANVVAYDPMVSSHPLIAIASDPYEAAQDAEALVVLTEWPQFSDIELHRVAEQMAIPRVLDTRSVINPESALAAGMSYRAPGRSKRRRRIEPAY